MKARDLWHWWQHLPAEVRERLNRIETRVDDIYALCGRLGREREGAPALATLLSLSAAGEPVLEDGVSAMAFDPVSFPAPFEYDTVRPGERVVLAVLNTSEDSVEFNAVLFGDTERVS